jgi:uncharacterized FlaG/YvyC family protein
MNSTILILEQKKNEILRQRNDFKWNSDKESETFEPNLKRFDDELDKVVKDIKTEWGKLYKR